jgi:hypothetical protein
MGERKERDKGMKKIKEGRKRVRDEDMTEIITHWLSALVSL